MLSRRRMSLRGALAVVGAIGAGRRACAAAALTLGTAGQASGLNCEVLQAPPLPASTVCQPLHGHAVVLHKSRLIVYPPTETATVTARSSSTDGTTDGDDDSSLPSQLLPPVFMQNFPVAVHFSACPLNAAVDCDVHLPAPTVLQPARDDQHQGAAAGGGEVGRSSSSSAAGVGGGPPRATQPPAVPDPAIGGVLYAHVPDLYNLYHAFFDVVVPIAHTMAQHGLGFEDSQLVLAHDPTLTHAMPWLDEATGLAADFRCSRPPFDMRGWQFLPYLRALTRRPIRWVLAPEFQFSEGDPVPVVTGDTTPQPARRRRRSRTRLDRNFHRQCLAELVVRGSPRPPSSPFARALSPQSTSGTRGTNGAVSGGADVGDDRSGMTFNHTNFHGRDSEQHGDDAAADDDDDDDDDNDASGAQWWLPDPFDDTGSQRVCLHGRVVLGVDASPRIWALTDDYEGTPAQVPADYPFADVFRRTFREVIGPQFAATPPSTCARRLVPGPALAAVAAAVAAAAAAAAAVAVAAATATTMTTG